MKFIDKFSDASSGYKYARPSYPDRLICELSALSPDRSLAWDSGTGNGQAAIQLAKHFESVYATDPSEQQIANREAHAKIKYAVEPAETPSLPDNSVSLAVSAQALHWYDLPQYFDEVKRVLKPGGIIAAFGYTWFFINEKIDEAVENHLLAPIRSHWAENNKLLWDGYRTINFPGDELFIPPFAIHLRWSLEDMLSYVGTWSATRACIHTENPTLIDEARAKLSNVWEKSEHKLHITMPMHIRASKLH